MAGKSVLRVCFAFSMLASCLTKPQICLNINDLHGPANSRKKSAVPRFAFLCYSLFHQVCMLYLASCYYVCHVVKYFHLSGFAFLRFSWFPFFTFLNFLHHIMFRDCFALSFLLCCVLLHFAQFCFFRYCLIRFILVRCVLFYLSWSH